MEGIPKDTTKDSYEFAGLKSTAPPYEQTQQNQDSHENLQNTPNPYRFCHVRRNELERCSKAGHTCACG